MKKILLSITLACFGLSVNSFAQTVLTQNFEGGITPWTNAVTGGGSGWLLATTATTTQLGAIPAHTKYAVVDESASTGTNYNNPALLTSPVFSLVGVTSPYLVFDYYYFQAWLSASPYTHEAAWVQMSTDGGASYSLVDSITANTTAAWGTHFVSLGSFAPTANCMLQFCYMDRGAHIIGVAVDNIMVYGASATDLGLTTVAPIAGSSADYFLTGGSATFSGTVTNYNSTTDITSFDVNYQVGASSIVTSTVSVSVPHLGSAPFTAPTPYTVAAGQSPVKMWVTATGDANPINDSMNTAVVGVAFMPKKRLIYEEGTGTWCGWCVRGIVYMDSLWRADSGSVCIVSVHNSDPMSSLNTSTTQYDNLISSMISGYPSMVIDRKYVSDPGDAFADYAALSNNFGFAELTLSTKVNGGNIYDTITVKPALDLTGDYRMELVVEQDDVTSGGGSTGTWLQHNYYAVGGAGHGTPMATVGYNFNTLPTDVPNVKFPFVARYTLPNNLVTTPNGVAGSLPASMTSGTTYTWTPAAIAIPSTWDSAHLRVVVMLMDNNPANPTYGQVLNSVSASNGHPAVVDTSHSSIKVANVNNVIEGMQVFPNPAADEAHIRFTLHNSTNVSFSIFDMVGREVFKVPAEQMVAGGQQINISTANLAAGVYNIVLTTENGMQSQHLSIVR